MTSTFRSGYALLVTSLAAMCTVGYLLVLYIFYKKPRLLSSNLLILSLGVSDAFIILRCIRTVFSCLQIWTLNEAACQDDAFIAMAFTLISISTAAAISEEKYQAACNSNNRSSSFFTIMKTWLVGIFFATLPLYGISSYSFETDDPELQLSCLLDFRKRSVIGTVYITTIFAVFMIRPLYEIFTNYKRASELTSVAKTQSVTFQAHKLIPLQMVVSLAPYASFAFLTSFGIISQPNWYFYSVINNIMAKIFIATNPFVYILSDPELNLAFKQMIGLKQEDAKESSKNN